MILEPTPTVIEIREGEESVEVIATAIQEIATAAQELLSSGLTERGLIILLQDYTGLGKREIREVLRALPKLRAYIEE
jgi:hypothetical protein